MPDSWEVEQKYVVHAPRELQDRLAALGFDLQRVEQHRDIYFRHPSRDFRATDEAFRLRRVGDDCCVTYKGKRLPGVIKTRQEIELPVGSADWQSWLELIQVLGFEPLPAVLKQRHVYLPGDGVMGTAPHAELDGPVITGIQVVLDDVQQLGNFAEIELLVTDSRRLEAARQQIAWLAAQLDLHDVQPRSYLSQLLSKLGVE